MLGKLFKRTGATRVEEIQAMSASTDAARLQSLVADASLDEALRAAALRQLGSVKAALPWWQDTGSPEAVRQVAADLLQEALQADPEATLAAVEELAVTERLELLQQLAPDRVPDWLAAQPEATCLALAQQSARPQDRLRAAEHLESLAALQELQRAAKGRDKALYRLAKSRLQNLRAIAAEHEARDEALIQVRQGLEKLAQSTWDPLLEGRFNHLLQKLDDIDPESAERAQIEPLAEQVRQRIQQHRSEEAAAAEAVDRQQAEAANAARVLQEARSELQGLVGRAEADLNEQLKSMVESGQLLPEDYAGATEWLQELEHSTLAALTAAEGGEALRSRLQSQFALAGQCLQALHDITLDWHSLATLTRAVQEGQAGAERALHPLVAGLQKLGLDSGGASAATELCQFWVGVRAERDARAEDEKRRVGSIRGLIRRGRGAVRGGHLRQARGIWRNISEQLEELGEGHAGLREEAEEFNAELQKLADWQDFAVVPKLQELIDHMRQLTERHMHPQDKADAVQALQQEWRRLTRGSGGRHQALWDEFHALADEAYAPCKEYFAEQSELQALNLEKRRELIQQLHLYHETNDWHDPDWTEVEKVLRLAARDWRQFSPVKPKDHRATEKDYHAIVDRIRQQLHREYDRNRAERERIIEAARELREEENLRTATERLKELQREWKQSGRTHRKDDQKLWRDFRAICDELFARRDEQTQAFKAELDQHLSDALAVIERIEAAAELEDDQALQAALNQLPDWEQAFQACSPLPKARVEETRQRFRKAVQALRSARSRQRHSRDRASWQALFDRVLALSELEAAMTAGRFEIPQREQVQALWADDTGLPALAARVEARLQQSLARFEASSPPLDEPEPAEQYRRQVILLEVLTDTESPEEDKSLRMEIQVQRLADSMGQQTNRRDVESALEEWMRMPVSLPENQYRALHERARSACFNYFFKADQ